MLETRQPLPPTRAERLQDIWSRVRFAANEIWTLALLALAVAVCCGWLYWWIQDLAGG